MSRTIDYFLALSSPWTCLAGPRLRELAERHDLAVAYRPFDIMSVFRRNGTKPVGERPRPVQANRLRELARWRAFLDMPINLHPKHFPVDPTLAGKTLIAAQQAGAGRDRAMAFADGCLAACWTEERDIADADTVAVIADGCGLDGRALVADAAGAAAQAAFEENTRQAIDRDVFGSPTWIVGDEFFWGQDRLDFLARHLEAGG